ncbi:Tyrosine recombinase XerC [subsurface metagenome]
MTGSPITLTNHDCEKLLEHIRTSCKGTKSYHKAIRNYCIAILMLDAGMRVGEVVQLNIDDLYFLNESRYQLRIREQIAKNHKERIVPLSNRIRKAIESMQVHVWSGGPEHAGRWAFCSNQWNTRLTTRQVERIVRKAAMKSLGRPVHPHVLRHTFASRLMRTTNARIVQELLGHEHLTTTQIYTHPNQEDLKKAIGTLEDENAKLGVDLENLAGLDSATNRPDAVDADGDMG